MQRALLSWTLVFALLVAGFGASVLALNGDVFSAHGFVRAYLDTLARHDASEALQFDGVELPHGVSYALITDNDALGDVDGIRFISDVETGDDHVVRFGTLVAGQEQVTEFHVERTGTRFGLFPTWRFSTSPVAVLNVTVDRDARFSANGVATLSRELAVLVPGEFVLDHQSKYLEADAVTVAVTEVGSTVDATVSVTPKPEFTEAATAAIAAFLDDCVTQEVLKPTGCPFGTEVINRLNSTPAWSMVDYPTAALEAGELPGQWNVKAAAAVAHIKVEVKAVFDGTVSALDEDVPFSSSYVVYVGYYDVLTVSAPPPA